MQNSILRRVVSFADRVVQQIKKFSRRILFFGSWKAWFLSFRFCSSIVKEMSVALTNERRMMDLRVVVRLG